MQSFRDHSISFCPVSVSIRLLRSYFNQQYYIMLYVYVIVCCFRAHSVSHCSRKRMQQDKKTRKKSRFLDFEKNKHKIRIGEHCCSLRTIYKLLVLVYVHQWSAVIAAAAADAASSQRDEWCTRFHQWSVGFQYRRSITRGGSMVSGALGKISRLCPLSDGPSDDGFQLTLSVLKFTYLINE